MKLSLCNVVAAALALVLVVCTALPADAVSMPVARPAAPLPSPPAIQARNWVLVDFASGQSLAESNADQRIEPASLTKLMSAYAVFSALRAGRLLMSEKVLIS